MLFTDIETSDVGSAVIHEDLEVVVANFKDIKLNRKGEVATAFADANNARNVDATVCSVEEVYSDSGVSIDVIVLDFIT